MKLFRLSCCFNTWKSIWLRTLADADVSSSDPEQEPASDEEEPEPESSYEHESSEEEEIIMEDGITCTYTF